ncbi:dihydropteroate synthase [archaeon]|nr:dihydropteroate synthase [archaeon]
MNNITCKNHRLSLDKTLIMGILNVTPDSFSDGGLYVNAEKAVMHAKEMVAEGADIIDVGGESSRPGSDPVSVEEELRRVLPVIERLVQEVNVPISIDTTKWQVAAKCLEAGAHILNDISGLADDKMIDVVAKYNVPVCIMHMQGIPKVMQQNPAYGDVITDIITFFEERIQKAKNAGISQLILDPGIGFGKKLEHNLTILKRLNEFTTLGYPLLVGTSRKSFIGKISNVQADDRLEGTIASNVIAVMNGANIIRVHDVKESKRAMEVVDAVLAT